MNPLSIRIYMNMGTAFVRDLQWLPNKFHAEP